MTEEKSKIEKIIKARMDISFGNMTIKTGKIYWNFLDLVVIIVLSGAALPLMSLILENVMGLTDRDLLFKPLLIWSFIVFFVVRFMFNDVNKKIYIDGLKGHSVNNELSKIIKIKDFLDYPFEPDSLSEREISELNQLVEIALKNERAAWKDISLEKKEFLSEIKDYMDKAERPEKRIEKLFIMFEKNENRILVTNE